MVAEGKVEAGLIDWKGRGLMEEESGNREKNKNKEGGKNGEFW